jgi:hypothetical protein
MQWRQILTLHPAKKIKAVGSFKWSAQSFIPEGVGSSLIPDGWMIAGYWLLNCKMKQFTILSEDH